MTYLPSLPAKGEVLGPNIMLTVGSSTVIMGSASGSSMSAMVSPIWAFSMPERATMSPAPTSSTSMRSSPRCVKGWTTRVLVIVPSLWIRFTGSPRLISAAPHAPDHDAPEILGVVQVGDEHLEGGGEIYLRGGDLLQHRLEELPHVVLRLVQVS